MSASNGKPVVDKSLVEKEALAAVVKQLVGGVERRLTEAVSAAVHQHREEQRAATEREVAELSRRLERYRLDAQVPVQKNIVEVEPIRDLLRAERATGDAERAKALATVKELAEAVKNLPAPTFSVPESPVTVDLSPITELVGLLRDDLLESRLEAEGQRRLTGELVNAVAGLTLEIEQGRHAHEALAQAITTLAARKPDIVALEALVDRLLKE